MEQNQKKKKKSPRQLVMGILLVIMVVSSVMVVYQYIEGKKAEEEYRHLAELAKQTTEAQTEARTEARTETSSIEVPSTEAPYVSPVDFEKLREINPDIVGWIRIPGTNIDYPIVQSDNNDTYLHTDFHGEESIYGSIFLDFESDSDMMGKNNIIYGHNMKNGSMFKDLVNFKDKDYFKEHQYFEIYTPERTIRLKAVSSYYDKARPIVRKTRFKTDESYEAFVQEMLRHCEYAEIPKEPVQALYTLVTCSYEVDDARTLVFAVEVEEEGK